MAQALTGENEADMNVLWIVGAYLMGSIASAVVVARLMGLPDPRTQGSGNPGATNVLRLGGKKAAALTLLGDVLKGVIPVLAARLAGLPETGVALVALAAFLGHLYPVFFGFKGGKGVATAFGVLVAGVSLLGLAILATWLAVAFATRISSLSALTAAALAPLYAHWLGLALVWTVVSAVIAVLVFWRHRSNIRNLLAGREERIDLRR